MKVTVSPWWWKSSGYNKWVGNERVQKRDIEGCKWQVEPLNNQHVGGEGQ